MRGPATPLERPRTSDPLAASLDRYLLTGDEAAIEHVVAETRPRLLAAARRIGAPQDAEDAVQTAYLSLVRRRGAPLDAPVLPWLLTAVVRNAYRRKAVQRREDGLAERLARSRAASDVGEGAAILEEAARLRAAVTRLPARYRDPAILHLLEGLSIGEVGRLLDLPEGTVRTRLHRARLLVRSRVDARIVASLLALPWCLADAGRDGAAGNVALGVGGGAKLGVLGLAAALLVAIGLGVGLLAGGPSAEETSRSEARAARVRALEAEIATLRGDLAVLASRRADPSLAAATPPAVPRAESGEAVATAPVPAAPARAPAAAAKSAPKPGPRIVFEGSGVDAWDVDWTEVGRRLREMVPLVAEFAQKWGTSNDPRLPDLVGRLSELNGPLVNVALEAHRHLKTGDNANDAFVHPWFMANAIAATLEAAKQPLSEAQEAALRAAGDVAVAEERRRTSGFTEETFALERLIATTEVRTAFFDAALGALDPGQRAVLEPSGTKGRLQGDLFSPVLLWTGRADGSLLFGSLEELSGGVRRLVGYHGLPAASRPAADRVIADWLADWPTVLRDAPDDPMSRQGRLPLAWVLEAAGRHVTLTRRLVESAAVDDVTATWLRSGIHVLVPVYNGLPRR